MCGIAGIWNLKGQQAAFQTLQKMLSVQQHRGPEDAAYTAMANESVLLGFLKLGFTDEQTGMQPIFNEDGKIAIVYNGEIYDYEAIRSDLQKKGHRFYTQSDSEVLVHLYEEYGEDFVHQLNGEFAFVIYDDHKKQLFAARDPFGINPLTYFLSDNNFYFSSEAKGLLATGAIPPSLCPDYLHSVAIGIPNTRLTAFKGIQNLRPGHCLVVNQQGIKTIYPYWNPTFEKTTDSFEQAKKRLRIEVSQALDRRLSGNPPIALSLSSGVDSTIIAGLNKELGYRRPIFSLGFNGRSFDEASTAAATAKHYGLDFHRVELSLDAIIENFEKTIFHTENITNSLSNSARFLMGKAVRDSGLKAITGGEASDEIFGGYPYFILEAIWRKKLAGDADAAALSKQFEQNEKLSHRIFWDNPKGWDSQADTTYPTPLLLYLRAKNAARLTRLWSKHSQQQFFQANGDAKTAIPQLFLEELPPEKCRHISAFDRTRLMSRSVISTFGFPSLGDRIEMGSSLEGRVPFLDKNVVEYGYSLPESYCLNMPKVQGKYVLREAFADLLPPAFSSPPKHTFMAPTFAEAFATSSGKAIFNQYLTADKIKASGIVNPSTAWWAGLAWRLMPRRFRPYLFIDSLQGLMLSVQILQRRFVEQDVMLGIRLLEVRLLDRKSNV